MKIIYVDLGKVWGGQEKYSASLMRAFSKKGYEIVSVSSQSEYKEFCDSYISVPISYRNFFSTSKKLEKIIAKGDIVHFNGNRSIYLSRLIGKKAGVRFIGTKHLPYSVVEHISFKNKLTRAIFPQLMKNLNALICVSSAIFKDLPRSCQKKSIVIHNGVKCPEDYDDRINFQGRLRLCYVARLAKHKGVMDIVNVVHKLIKKEASIELSIAGDGEMRNELEDYITEFNLTSVIHFHGFLSDPNQIYLNNDVCILPSTHEGLPLNILEAYSFGVPVVAYDIPGVNEIIIDGETGYMVPVGDLDGLMDRIHFLDKNRNTLQKLSIASKEKFKEKFSIESMFEKTREVYEA